MSTSPTVRAGSSSRPGGVAATLLYLSTGQVLKSSTGKVITRLRSLDHDSSLATARGWDNVTGLGSPDAFRLLFALR